MCFTFKLLSLTTFGCLPAKFAEISPNEYIYVGELVDNNLSITQPTCMWENCHNEENSDRQRKFSHRGHVSPKTRPSRKPNQPHRTARVV